MKEKLNEILNSFKNNNELQKALFYGALFLVVGLTIISLFTSFMTKKYHSVAIPDYIKDIEEPSKEEEEPKEEEEEPSTNPDKDIEDEPEEEEKEENEDLKPIDLFSSTCIISGITYLSKSNLDDKEIATKYQEQITVRFIEDSERFYDANIIVKFESLEVNFSDINYLQDTYKEKLNGYLDRFNAKDGKVVFDDVNTSYIQLKNLNYEDYSKGLKIETPNYNTFLLTFKKANYICK